jgi:hypothetical protein
MTRSYQISQIVQSSGPSLLGSIILDTSVGDVTPSFHGRYYRDSLGAILPGYTISPPAAYSLITATTFTVVDNPSYNGTYTVYSQTGPSDIIQSSVFASSKTNILVIQAVNTPLSVGHLLNTGKVTNISTYIIPIVGESDLLIPPTVAFSNRPITTVGKFSTPWGESYLQNFIALAQNFAGPVPPVNPYRGQTWYDDVNNVFNVRSTSNTWVPIGLGSLGSATSFRHVQGTPSTSWVVTHNLGLISPFVGIVQFFADIGGGVHKTITPTDITFTSTNQLTATFSSLQSGVMLLRS